jgi:hypothetical protein
MYSFSGYLAVTLITIWCFAKVWENLVVNKQATQTVDME